MVQLITGKFGAILQSTVEMPSEDCVEKIKNNPEQVSNILENINLHHTIVANEDGSTFSRVSRELEKDVDLLVQINELKEAHKGFLTMVSELPSEKKHSEEPQKEKLIDFSDDKEQEPSEPKHGYILAVKLSEEEVKFIRGIGRFILNLIISEDE